MKTLLTTLFAAALLTACASTIEPNAPHYATWKEKMDAEQQAQKDLREFVLRDMMYNHQPPVFYPVGQ